MEGIRFRRPLWTVMRFTEDADGVVDDARDIASFWDKAAAFAEASRLSNANDDPTIYFEVVESEASGVYPADETPPWIDDPERLARRGYEATE